MKKSHVELVTEVEIAQAHFPKRLPTAAAAAAEWRTYLAWAADEDQELTPGARLADYYGVL